MFDELAIARADGRLSRLMASWARVDVLVVDDFLIRALGPDHAADLLEVVEDRGGLRSTIVTSQLPVANWHEAIGERDHRRRRARPPARARAPHRAQR